MRLAGGRLILTLGDQEKRREVRSAGPGHTRRARTGESIADAAG
jgi:alkanesulfonate monooxygenase SsuD/methylene tetrahydromethanopterin reductase-like flavin-dependent oxidoreductase (luciferase family)